MKESSAKWDEKKPARENAAVVLPALAAEFFGRGRELASAAEISPEALHAFRLAAKRFRYSLEMFQHCYGPSLEDRLETLAALQGSLGQMSDCAATRRLLDGERFARFKQRPEFFAFLEQAFAERTAAFVQAWRASFDTEAEERRWVAYLSRPIAKKADSVTKAKTKSKKSK